MDATQSVTLEDIRATGELFAKDRAGAIAKNAVTAQGIRAVARVPEAAATHTAAFDIEISQGKRTNQKKSGRCWMFAALNIMRCRIIKRYKLKTYELSQAYPLFFDKLEKSNWFLENVIDTTDEPLDGRLVTHLLADPVGDGGQWDMFRALVEKYGVVPKEAMPETACSSNTHEMDAYLTRYLRGCAKELREAAAAGSSHEELRAQKKEMLERVERLLITCLGEPPATFDVRLRNKDDELVLEGSFTPQRFFAEVVDLPIGDYVSVISANTPDKPFGHVFSVSRLGNVVEAGGVRYLNLPIERLKELAIAQLKADEPVWFGCDVDQSYLRSEGVMDMAALDVDALFGFAVEGCLTRAERLAYGESLMTHAMVLEGVNLDGEERPTLWKVENSWGDDRGKDGFDSISDAWFDEYVYQVVVDRRFLSDSERATYESEEARMLAPWDPMGSLAR